MQCPNCNAEIRSYDICPNCGVDPILFRRAIDVSNYYYNSGLKEIKRHNLSSALEKLNKSIELNRSNYNAHNILGLTYYEMGLAGDAIKQWIISSSLVKENNLAKEYLQKFQADSRVLEDYNNAIDLYNQSIEFCKKNNEDMAIINLKKAVDISPKFVKAMQLLTLIYITKNELSKAESLISRILAIDAQNAKALLYYNEIHTVGSESPENSKISSYKKVFPMPSSHSKTKEVHEETFFTTYHVAEIITFFIGVLCAFAVSFLLIYPSLKLNSDSLASSEESAAEYESTITDLNSQVSSLQSQNNDLQSQVTDLTSKLTALQGQAAVSNAQSLYDSGDYEGAADAIAAIDISKLSPDDAQTVTDIQGKVYPKAAEEYYNDGVSCYKKGDNATAETDFKNCVSYADPQEYYVDDALYFLGSIAEKNGDNNKAISYYENVITNYPDSNVYQKSESGIARLSQ